MRKKITSLVVVALISLLTLTACGSSVKEELVPYEGKWVAIVAEMFGVQTGIEEAVGGTMELDVKSTGDVHVIVGEDEGEATCSVEGDQFTLVVDDEEMVGTIDGDTITFNDMLGMGLKVIFAKDGTDAMDPTLYVTEDQKAIVGEWQSVTVEEVLGDGAQTTFPGVDNIHDALRLNFSDDQKVVITYKAESLGSFSWDVALGMYTIDSEDPSLFLTMNDAGNLEVSFSYGDDYYDFVCEKVE